MKCIPHIPKPAVKFQYTFRVTVDFSASNIDSDNGLAPVRREAINWSNDG